MNIFRKVFIFSLYYSFLFHSYVGNKISNEKRCVDAKCSVPISVATTQIRYHAADKNFLSFLPRTKAIIFSKEAGDNPNYWEAEIKGKRGYVPKTFLREEKVLVKPSDVNVIVPTGRIDQPNQNVTQKTIVKTEPKSADLSKAIKTEVNSKGMFSMIGGVSADSVPPSPPHINPQSSREYKVFGGTTIYEDPVTENFQNSPEVLSEVKETPSMIVIPSSQEPEAAERKSTLKTSKYSPNESESVESKNVDKIENKQPSEGSKKVVGNKSEQSHHEKSEDLAIIENEQSTEESKESRKESEASPKESEVVAELKSEQSSEKQEESPETVKKPSDKDKEVKSEANILESSVSTGKSSSSMLSNVVNTVSNYFSSGSGAMEEGEEDEVSEEEYNEDEGSGEEEQNVGEIRSSEPSAKEISDVINLQQEATLQNEENHMTHVQNEPGNKSKAHTPLLDVLDQNSNLELARQETVITTEPNIVLTKELAGQDAQAGETASKKTEKVIENSTGFESGNTDGKTQNNLSTSAIDHLAGKQVEESKEPENKTVETAFEEIMQTKNETEHLKHQHEHVDASSNFEKKDITSTLLINKSMDSNISPEVVEESKTKPYYEVSEVSTSTESPKTEQKTTQDFYRGPRKIQDSSEQTVHANTESLQQAIVETKAPAESQDSSNSDKLRSTDPTLHSNPLFETTESPAHSSLTHTSLATQTHEDEEDSKESLEETKIDFAESEEALTINTMDQAEIAQDIPKDDLMDETTPLQDTSEPAPISDISSDTEVVENIVPDAIPIESQEMFSWFNPVYDLFASFGSSRLESEEASSDDQILRESNNIDLLTSSHIKEESCLADGVGEEACESLKDVPVPKDVSWQDSLYSADISSTLDLFDKIPLETTIWLVITAVVVLVFSLGHYYIEAHRRDGPLVAVINKLEREVLILKKESCILEDRLQTAQEQLEAWNVNSAENDALIVELKEDLEETRTAKAELEEQVGLLEREVESVTESGLEMHRLLSESLSSQDGSQVLFSTVEMLREKLEHQEDEIAGLSQSLSHKNIEVEELKEKLAQSAEAALSLEDRIVAVTREKEEEALQLKEKHRQLIAQLEEVMETKALDETRVSTEMSRMRLVVEELQKSLAEKDSELEELKEVVKQLRSTDSNEKMDALFDVVSVQARLKEAIAKRNEYREKFQEEEGARKLLEGHMKKITLEVAELKNSFETAEKDKIEALTKLQVLSNYFKEKESQLQKELGMQESMWLQKQSDDHTIYEQMRSLREENEKYKLQNESLKKEIVEQESSFKIQLANTEQKAHEHWVASRQAERKVKEVQQEAAQLRNRLTMEKNSANYSLDDSKQNISESNGDPSSPPPSLMFPPTTSPPFMMYPMPPPGDFVPPPPLMGSPYPSDSRPPPLGRISSPPLDHRFSPPPPLPYPPYDYAPYGHHSPSPPPPMPPHSHHRNVHKPQPREMAREQKDHVLSNYSPEADKTIRRNKR